MTVQFDPTLIADAPREAITGDQLVYVVDSSNIEARVLAWVAGHQSLLQQFRDKEDVYINFATKVYQRPLTKKLNPLERHVGKTCVLGLGFQVGWKKLQSSLATNDQFPMWVEEADCRHMVNLYRSDNSPVVDYWAAAELAIYDMYQGNERQWGALQIYKNALIMPNGMALQYPHLRPSEPDEQGRIGWEYWNGKFFTNLYGGKLCLAKGTLVLTRAGWLPIEYVTAKTEVWDGAKWVYCDGNVYNGDKPVIELAGITMTADHEVLTNAGWKTASQSQGHNRAESGLPDGDGIHWQRWEEIPMASPVHLRAEQDVCSCGSSQVEKARLDSLLRMQERRDRIAAHDYARDVQAPSLLGMALNAGSLSATYASSVGQLRWTWHSGMQAVAGFLRSLLGGHGTNLPVGIDARTPGQRAPLRSEQLHVGWTQSPSQQPPQLGASRGPDHSGAVGTIGTVQVDPLVSVQPWLAIGQATVPVQSNQPVYDLINCGPNNRFVVRDGNGKPLIVHNCENIVQALSRIVLFRQMLKIDTLFGSYGGESRVALSVHDEVVSVGPSFGALFLGLDANGKEVWENTEGADALFDKTVQIMRTPEAWCHDLPLDGEGGFAFEYSK